MAELTTVLTGVDFGEGPRWHEGRLWFSDFYRGGVYTLDGEGNEELQLQLDDRPSGLGWMPDGTMLVVSMVNRCVLAVGADGRTRTHADLSGLAAGFCNDMVVAADGTAYVGNFGFDSEGGAEFATATLIRVSPVGAVSEVAADLMFPNGAVITPDGSTLIVGETYGSQYTAWDIAGDGTLSNRRLWANVEGSAPDGCCLDAEGGIWMADFIGGRVARVVEGGEITDEFAIGEHAVACMLGGDDRRTLYILRSPSSDPKKLRGKGLSAILTAQVAVPGAGLP
jgi:sugar lactone lactonase YvrE